MAYQARYIAGTTPAPTLDQPKQYRPTYRGGGYIIRDPASVEPCVADTPKMRTVRVRDERRRANTTGKRYRLQDVAARDGYRCHLCGKLVDMTLSGRHPMGPTADHLIPVAHGGGDDPANIKLAHSTCNVHRGTGGTVQLALHCISR